MFNFKQRFWYKKINKIDSLLGDLSFGFDAPIPGMVHDIRILLGRIIREVNKVLERE